jgi:uncharacterized protein YdaT
MAEKEDTAQRGGAAEQAAAAMPAARGKDQHVVPHERGWAVLGEGNARVSSIHPTQGEAVDVARRIARSQGSEVVIHGKDGEIRDSDSYGNDPFPPRDKVR